MLRGVDGPEMLTLEMVGFPLSAQKASSRARLFAVGQEGLRAVSNLSLDVQAERTRAGAWVCRGRVGEGPGGPRVPLTPQQSLRVPVRVSPAPSFHIAALAPFSTWYLTLWPDLRAQCAHSTPEGMCDTSDHVTG